MAPTLHALRGRRIHTTFVLPHTPPYMRHPTRPVHVTSSRLNSIFRLPSSRQQLNMLAKEDHANLKAHLAERQLAVRRKWTSGDGMLHAVEGLEILEA
jgi:hypothetical protein